ncbi:hypothetical protein [uncultured Pseudoteredinibacter sp.]|uniref:hypothetical protein n=1 Tax=uncultured Pseudoteredinibacter sp. TaxID=1641701 RepID=UPI0026017DA4|nr:hypothetical protein [uncultured Pseudoteredinibacter sp.]
MFNEVLSVGDSNSRWFLITAAVVLVISLVEAWIVSLIYYLKVQGFKKIFPSPHQLIRSHVDYCIMAGLLGLFYVAVQSLNITLPTIIIALACIGAIYNPSPFIIMAMKKPDELRGGITRKTGVFICIGVMPVTIGYGYIAFSIIGHALL